MISLLKKQITLKDLRDLQKKFNSMPIPKADRKVYMTPRQAISIFGKKIAKIKINNNQIALW